MEPDEYGPLKSKVSRRDFLKAAGIGAVAVVLAGGATRVLTGCAPSTTAPGPTISSTSTPPSTISGTGTSIVTSVPTITPTSNPPVPGEVEATEFMGTKLTPIRQQDTSNAIYGVQQIDEASYRLIVDGLVDNPLSLNYADLLALPQTSKLMPLNCVEGWSYMAKWTGPALEAIFAEAKVQSSAKIAIFYTADDSSGFTSLDLSYIQSGNIIIALKDNDITLPSASGFPVKVVAENKYGYKWAKWVTHIGLSDNADFRGYWESNGYNNNADIGGPAFGF